VLPVRLIFITGTDTGVGKTILTSLLLAHLRERGVPALALKPFCSGSRSDATLLHSLIDHELTLDEINPFYFPEPLAPLVAARKHCRRISLRQVLAHISRITHHASLITPSTLSHSRTPTLLIEGAGGLLAPLAEDCTALDIIRSLNSEVLVVAPNKLGTINHTLLTIGALQAGALLPRARSKLTSPICHLPSAICHLHAPRCTRVVLMNCRFRDASAASNPRILSELLTSIPVHSVPFLRPALRRPAAIRKHAAVLQRKLAALCRKP
jgi:dethiobiotin synthase